MNRHIFIVNPAAGKGVESHSIGAKITDACKAIGLLPVGADSESAKPYTEGCFEIYKTTGVGDATAAVRARIAAKQRGENLRFYACGGDGTLSEVIAGAVDESLGRPIHGVSVGCIPIGTGNDFVRNFEQSQFFPDITKQLLADPVTIDCFAVNSRYGINMVNIGFDCDVVVRVAEIKKKRFVPKRLAYILGVLDTLKKNLGRTITVITADGKEITHEFQLVAVANGGFCGGGFHSAPRSRLDDGLLDVSLIDKVSRRTLLTIIGAYKKGTHLETKLGKKIVSYTKAKSITMRFAEESNVCIDGEIVQLKEASFRVVKNAVSFLIPVGVVYPAVLPEKSL